VLEGGQFRRNNLPAGLVLLDTRFQASVQFKNAFFDGFKQLGFSLFDLLQFRFQFLGALPVLAAVLISVCSASSIMS